MRDVVVSLVVLISFVFLGWSGFHLKGDSSPGGRCAVLRSTDGKTAEILELF